MTELNCIFEYAGVGYKIPHSLSPSWMRPNDWLEICVPYEMESMIVIPFPLVIPSKEQSQQEEQLIAMDNKASETRTFSNLYKR